MLSKPQCRWVSHQGIINFLKLIAMSQFLIANWYVIIILIILFAAYITWTAVLCILTLITDAIGTTLTGLGLKTQNHNLKYRFYRIAVFFMILSCKCWVIIRFACCFSIIQFIRIYLFSSLMFFIVNLPPFQLTVKRCESQLYWCFCFFFLYIFSNSSAGSSYILSN